MSALPPLRRTVSDGQISLLEWGEAGQPLVLLHGITSSARTWWRVAPALVELGYHVFAFDMPGHGESASTDDHRIPAIAGQIAAAIAELGLQDITLIGHSWGGATALVLASGDYASVFRKVVLVDPALGMNPERGAQALPNFLTGVGQSREETVPQLVAANPDWHTCDVFWKAEALEQCRKQAVVGLFTLSGTWYLLPNLAEVAAPLLLLVADPKYTVIPPDALETARQSLTAERGTILTVPGTTHNMFRGNGFAPTLEALQQWLRSA